MEDKFFEKKENNRKRKFILISLVIALAIVLSFVGYYFWYNGTYFVSTEDAHVNADLVEVPYLGSGGQIKSVYLNEGDEVTQGTILAILDQETAQAQYDSAEARNVYTLAILRRDKELLDNSEGISLQQYDTALYDYNTAKASLEIAEIAIEKTYVRAPISGLIIKNDAFIGEYVTAGTILATMIDTKKIYVIANIEETKLEKIKPGQLVDITIDQYHSKKFIGRVNSIVKAANSLFSILPTTTGDTFTKVVQKMEVKIDLDYDDVNLLPGANADVRIHVR